ncbi:MAG: Crp/Fnr family transcriptional regulator, partial [Clostridium sp.]
MDNVSCKNCKSKLCTKNVPILKSVESKYLEDILNKVSHKKYSKGEIIFTEGKNASTLYFISNGRIKLYKYTKEGKEQILHILGDGDFFGELDLLRNSEYGFSAKVIEEAKICTFSKEEMRDLMMKNPGLGINLLENIGSRLAELENLAQNLASNNIDS